MSSRNALLSSKNREKAPRLFSLLADLANAIAREGAAAILIERTVESLKQNGFGPVDYLAYVDGETLEPLDRYLKGGRLIAAAFLGNVRLIDNVAV
jgi:pantoate--beta-alanine ligase